MSADAELAVVSPVSVPYTAEECVNSDLGYCCVNIVGCTLHVQTAVIIENNSCTEQITVPTRSRARVVGGGV